MVTAASKRILTWVSDVHDRDEPPMPDTSKPLEVARLRRRLVMLDALALTLAWMPAQIWKDRKSTRLNSSH
jgi:hypothetical protein